MINTPPQVLFFDPITWVDDGWRYDIETAALAPLGVDVVIPDDRAARDRSLATADVVVVSSIDNLTAADIHRLERCVGILCYSAGMDAVDLAAAAEKGIPVTNVRAGTVDVADHAMALLLSAWRMLPEMTAAVEAHRWEVAEHPRFRSIPRLEGATVGIFGAGAIGRAVADRARAFGITTIATYRRPESATADLPHVPVEQLFAESDAVVLTASLTPSSKGIVNRRLLEGARAGMVLVNVGRGGLIVEGDLVWALDQGIVRAAGLDVRDPEPPDPDSDPLAGRSDVIGTPHLAGMSAAAIAGLPRLAAEAIETLLRQGDRI